MVQQSVPLHLAADLLGLPERRLDVLHDRLEDAGVEFDAELVRHGDEDGVRRLDGRTGREFGGDDVGFADEAATEAREPAVEMTDLVLRVGLRAQAEVTSRRRR